MMQQELLQEEEKDKYSPQSAGHCLTASTAGNVKKVHSCCVNGKSDNQKLVCVSGSRQEEKKRDLVNFPPQL